MEVGILGDLRVMRDGRPLALGPHKQRLLLAVLVLQPGTAHQTDQLVEALWGETAPTSAADNVRLYVHRMRRLLGPDRIVGHGRSGYELHIEPGVVDATRFTDLVRAGEAAVAAGNPVGGRERLVAALALWRGAAFGDLGGEAFLRTEAARLEESRLAALEQRIAVDLALGVNSGLVAELSDLVAAYPFRERFAAQLMLALYRTGRQVEALEVGRRVRRRLIDEIGVEPGAELRRVEAAILAGGSGAPATRRNAVPEKYVDRPAQLPAAPGGFVGRVGELAALRRTHGECDGGGIAAVVGPAGMGKTALALRWANGARDLFPDGQLYVDLHGFGAVPALAPATVLDGLLRSLGVPAIRIPTDVDRLAAEYRSQLADRRMLVVLDNAAGTSQVQPLLPGGRGTFTVVTSRDRLDGLVAAHGATRLPVGPLPPTDAMALVSRMLPGGLTPATAPIAERLAQLCERMPLALRIAASRLDSAARGAADDLAMELADERRRLDVLSVDGGELSVRAALAASVGAQSPGTRRVFRLLGVHPGGRFSVDAGAALAGMGVAAVTAHLDRLCAAHLLDRAGTDRYEMHDLVRIYAAERCRATDRRTALANVLTWYRDRADAADRALRPGQRPNFAGGPEVGGTEVGSTEVGSTEAGGTGQVAFADESAALAWLDAESGNLVAAVRRAAGPEPRLAWQIAAAMFGWLARREHRGVWVDLYRVAIDAAERAGDRAGVGLLTSRLVIPYSLLGRSAEAIDAARRAFEIRRDVGDPLGAATALLNLAAACTNGGQPAQAIEHLQQAGPMVTGLPDAGHFRALLHSNLGEAYQAVGQPEKALAHLAEALRAARARDGDGPDVAHILVGIARVHLDLDEPGAAATHAERALDLARRAGDRAVEASVREVLGQAHAATGDTVRAIEQLELSLAGYEEIGHGQAGRVRTALHRVRPNTTR